MRKLSLFIAFAMLAALTMVSCNNKPKEPTQEEVQEMKQALADSVLAQIDAFADEFIIATENSIEIVGFELTEKEKQDKPDYLLDPSEANKFVTKSQKVSAFAFYIVDMGVRTIYDMPIEETKEAIAKLALEINYPFDLDHYEEGIPISERLRNEYEKCKENGDVIYFWQFHYAITTEFSYILVQNPELFYGKISEEQRKNYCQVWETCIGVIQTLAKYDDEMASLLELRNKYSITSSAEEREREYATISSLKQFSIDNKDKLIARRNAMLQ